MIEKELVLQLREINQKAASIMQQKFDDHELTIRLLHLLITIMNRPNTTQKELAREMRFTEGAMSISVKRLIKLNMVEQVQSQSDGRCNVLVVTEKGKLVINDYEHYLHGILKDIFKGCKPDELLQINQFLMKIKGNLDQMQKDMDKR